MSNSSLVSYTKLSPHKSSRNGHAIDTISIHCVVGQCGVEALGSVFQTKEASANYGIGYDGRIGLYVNESERSWCTSSKANDERAITIECASDATAPYAVNDKVYNALIDLLCDVCKRNNIYPLKWSTNKDDRVNHKNGCNMTVHRDYANKACPGDYIYNRLGQIASEVNERLEEENMVRYKTINEVPKWYQEETKELIELGFNGKGGDLGLDVTEDMLRTMIVNLRMCKALIAAIPEGSVDKDALFEEFKKNLKLTISVE
jgi:hypothetical protein